MPEGGFGGRAPRACAGRRTTEGARGSGISVACYECPLERETGTHVSLHVVRQGMNVGRELHLRRAGSLIDQRRGW